MKALMCLMAIIIVLCVENYYGQSVVRQLVTKNTPLLGCYKYDSYAVNEFTVNKQGKKIETDFLATDGFPSKVVFCQNGLYQGILIEVYDGNKTVKNRKKVYDNHRSANQNSWVFETKKSGRYYVEYTIPSSDREQKACVLMIQGCDYGDCSKQSNVTSPAQPALAHK